MATKKKVAKKAVTKKKVVKKTVAKKYAKKASYGREFASGKFVGAKTKASPIKKTPGYVKNDEGIYLPEGHASVVPSSKLRKGFARAKNEINNIVEDIVETLTDDYVISEIEFNVSFSADGKFLGIGVGGAASIKIKIAPE